MVYRKAEKGDIVKRDEKGDVMSPEDIELDIGDLTYRINNLNNYRDVIWTVLDARKNVIKGSGQAKRNAYKVRKSGDYGTLMVDLPKLTNEMVLQAYDGKGGALVYDAGYDLVNNLEGVIKEFDQIIGLDKNLVMHINDSKNKCGSAKDRHENIGFGHIGFNTLKEIVWHPKFDGIVKILETPWVDKKPPYKEEILNFRNKKFQNKVKEKCDIREI